MSASFTPSHRGGSGSPMVCLHGFTDTWRTWELVLPALEREHDVLAPTLAGHAGGPPIEGEVTTAVLADAVERAMDEAGFETAHIVGNSLGGYLALQLAARGRARTVVALAPAGGWAEGDEALPRRARTSSRTMQELLRRRLPRRGDRRHARGPAPGDPVHRHQLRAHPGRAARPPDARRRELRRRSAPLIEHALRRGLEPRRRADHLPRPDRLGHRGPDPAVAAAAAASATTGCRTPTGSSSTASAIARSSTCRPRPRS